MRPVCHWHKKLRDESGNVLVLVALCMTVLMGFMALAIDVGLMFRAKRGLQIVADAAATAGALEYYNTGSGAGVSTAARAAATANGVTNGVGGAVVTVINPVTSGAHTGSGTVEVDVSQPNPTFFMKVLGRSSMTVAARAVAGSVPGQACMFVNNLNVKGSSTIHGVDPVTGNVVTACGIYVNTNVDVKGNGNTIDVAYVADAGTLTGNQNTKPAPVITGAPKQTPPARITPPAPSSFASCGPPAGSTKKGNTYTATVTSLTPGTCYGFGSGTTLNLNLSNATLAPGLYTFNLGTGGTLTLGSNVSGSGITLNLYTGAFSVNSTNNDQLYAPTSGDYNGVLILEPTTNTGSIDIQWGSGSGNFAGIIDAPGASLSLQDAGGSGALVTGIIANTLTLGSGTLYVKNYSSVYPTGPFRTIALVE
jgi:Flp pilus assembly protein TadG